mgnify:CR=1 FL=1
METLQTSDGRPDAAWFELVADGGGLVFFVLRVQPDVGFEFLSDGVEEQIGCTAAEGLADPATVLAQIKPTHAERLAEAMAIPPGSETAVELTWHHRDGRPVHSRTWARCRQRPDGSVVLDGVTRDITQLREVEAELQTFQDRYRLLAENAWEVVWTASPNGAITYISPSVERVRGFTPAEAMSQSIEQTDPPATAAGVIDFYRRLFAAVEAGTDDFLTKPVFLKEALSRVELLLEKGADPNTAGGGFTALHAAVLRRDERMVRALLAHRADVNARVRSWTPTRRSSRDWRRSRPVSNASCSDRSTRMACGRSWRCTPARPPPTAAQVRTAPPRRSGGRRRKCRN